MKYPILGVMLAILSKSLIGSAQELTQTSSAVLTTTTNIATTTDIATTTTTLTAAITPYFDMPIAFTNITSVSTPDCDAYAALIIQCQPSIPATATTQTQKDLPLLQCLCHAGTFYPAYTTCTASMNLTSAWTTAQFSEYCVYIESGNVTLLSNGTMGSTAKNNGTILPPLVITVVTYISSPTTVFPTPTSSVSFPTSVSAATTISGPTVDILSRTLLVIRTMIMVALLTFTTPPLFY